MLIKKENNNNKVCRWEHWHLFDVAVQTSLRLRFMPPLNKNMISFRRLWKRWEVYLRQKPLRPKRKKEAWLGAWLGQHCLDKETIVSSPAWMLSSTLPAKETVVSPRARLHTTEI